MVPDIRMTRASAVMMSQNADVRACLAGGPVGFGVSGGSASGGRGGVGRAVGIFVRG